ncbi:DgyrCDS12731 [Dimorphilus gyrociliatus]|uniref:DgyrCDS12731 n=1 Tax=Dimorphilus gyrociliatus TaxID=2664684 RepID=A0A7I8W8F6_9ANNE|nr:DgyrCDS12731 [Dimorphilus gyrociliatus]
MKLSLKFRQIVIFVLGWVAYASTYFLRKPLGVIKVDLKSELLFSKSQLGWLDAALLFPYAMSQMFLGAVGDRFGARRTFAITLFISALSMITFGNWSSFYILVTLLFINGAAQAHCWPNCGKILGTWFSDKSRNSIFGLFGASAFVGGIVGTTLAVFLQAKYGWRNVFVLPSLITGTISLLLFFFFRESNEIGIDIPGRESSKESGIETQNVQKLSLLQLWKVICVKECAIGMFSLKLVRYTMYMWLPMYLLNVLRYSKAQAGMFSTMFEIGGVAGSAVIGFVVDRLLGGKALIGVSISIFLSAICLILFIATSGWGVIVNSVFLLSAGALNCGPDSLLGGSISADLGERHGAAAAVTGLINGFGSVGGFIEGPLIGFIADVLGWTAVFYVMVIICFMGSIAVYRAARLYEINQSRRSKQPESGKEPTNV